MPNYKDATNKLYWLESSAFAHVLPAGCVEITDEEAAVLLPVVSQIPQSVTRFQARAALYQAGILSSVEALMANEATPALAKLAWADAQEFKRSSPTIAAMAGALGLTSQQLDDLFTTAAGIDA